MGGRTYACNQCQTKISLYNSCADRHCPQCSGARRADWLDRAAELLLPDVTYFQVVFTLPDKLSPLILGNRRKLYRTLMHTAWEALKECIETKLGMQASAMMVLHTWNQRLGHHPHVHLLVPGSGPSLDGRRWIECRQTKPTGNSPAKPTLVDNKELSREFSERFLRKLKSLHRRGKLDLEEELAGLQEPLAWAKFTDTLLAHDWCVFIERPPTSKSSPEHVLKYLARYMTGGPISDRRLVSCDNDIVTFMARNKDKHSSASQVSEKLSGVEFIRCWSLHILPKGFTKSRCFGGYSSARRTAFIALCKQLHPLAVTEQCDPQVNDAITETQDIPTERCCAKCQQPMQLLSETRRPSWRDLFYGPNHHSWFES
ncbi:Putative transposase [Aureliella helgolandensis]|uniref:Transposase n=2 Tax=Aureliella helgolandensis TaxID=2527968 RepID=A0A518G110_9BACT|nr:Putative transposase [Aureliella helgolandensis]QDV22900.1 Putative transposase [Aureliella helgolandensis]QDV26753.1 Putative transposase [Aureliella helgolandensis]